MNATRPRRINQRSSRSRVLAVGRATAPVVALMCAPAPATPAPRSSAAPSRRRSSCGHADRLAHARDERVVLVEGELPRVEDGGDGLAGLERPRPPAALAGADPAEEPRRADGDGNVEMAPAERRVDD